MGEIDWSKLYQATSEESKPTPGYLFNDIVKDVSHADPRQIPAVAGFLADNVSGDHAHVKLKALFVIKTLAYRIPPFCNAMQAHLPCVQEAAAFTGPPSAVYGDEPYRLVREAAEGALEAMTGSEHYHEQYSKMSQRIVGFGNYLPAADTVLPDGSVNLGKDVRPGDVISSGVDFVVGGIGSVLGSAKEFVARSLSSIPDSRPALGFDGDLPVDVDEVEDDTGYDGEAIENTPGQDDVEDYLPSSGSYVPPWVPPAPATPEPEVVDTEPAGPPEDLLTFADVGAAETADLIDVGGVDDVLSEAQIMRTLGIDVPPAPPEIAPGEAGLAAAPRAAAESPPLLEASSLPDRSGHAASQPPVQQLPGGFLQV